MARPAAGPGPSTGPARTYPTTQLPTVGFQVL
jgi:hypothetical protein